MKRPRLTLPAVVQPRKQIGLPAIMDATPTSKKHAAPVATITPEKCGAAPSGAICDHGARAVPASAPWKIEHEGTRMRWRVRHIRGKPSYSFPYEGTEESKAAAHQKAYEWALARVDPE